MDRDLVVRAMAGEHDAFSELVRIGLDQLYVTARLILRDTELAEAREAYRVFDSRQAIKVLLQP